MRTRNWVLGFVAASCVLACDRANWPVNRGDLTQLFEVQKENFLAFEREMTADGILRMSPGVFSEMARNPTIPSLPSDQAAKYLALFERTEVFVSIVRREQSTEFEMMIENVGPRLYLYRFVHATSFEALPKCALAMDEMACGNCAIQLEDDWKLEYSWFPASPEEEARRC